MSEQKEKKLSTWQILRNKFPENECVLMQEVSDASGFSRSRSLDYMVVNLWQSRGLSVIGIEKKSNRGDWLKELKNPAKQENHYKHCDYFFLLTDKENVAKLEEIPLTWGWYHINEKGVLKTMKDAPKLSPEPIGKSLMCAMLRRAASKDKFVHVDSVQSFIEERSEQKRLDLEYRTKQKAENYDSLRSIVDEFEKAAGLKLDDYWWRKGDVSKIGEIVNLMLKGELADRKRSLEYAFNQVKGIYDSMKNGIDALSSIPDEIIILNNENKE